MTFDEFDPIDREIMNRVQAAFPLVAEPFRDIAVQIGTTEQDVIDRLAVLRSKNVVRQIGAIFDTRTLGYQSMLVAMRFPEGRLDNAARLLNQHPGISHNYGRDGFFNLWFTIAVPSDRSLKDEVEQLGVLTGAESTRLLPTIRFFKIGVNFDMVNGKSAAKEAFVPDQTKADASTVTQEVIDYIRVMQDDLELLSRPFDIMAQHPAVTHCYQRPTYDDWPYSHFTMVHGVSEAECEQFGREIASATGLDERKLVYSRREYKKTRVRYFVEDEFVIGELQPIG